MKIAMIGTGGMARRHLQTLVQEEGIEIVGHASPTPGHAEAAASQWGGRAYRNHDELLEQEDVDAVWISVPPDQHGDIERSLIARHIPFFVEKPLAADLDTAESIAALLSENKGPIAAVGYHWRAMDTVAELRQTLAENSPQMILAAWHGATPPPHWWWRRPRGGGQLVEQATHLFDFVRYLAGEATVMEATGSHLARAAFPDLDVDTTGAVLLQFDEGIPGVVTTTCLLQVTPEVYVKFVCNGLLITVERHRVVYEYGHERREVRPQADAVRRENQAFLAAVRQDDDSLLYSNYQDALLTHRLCWQAQQRADAKARPSATSGEVEG